MESTARNSSARFIGLIARNVSRKALAALVVGSGAATLAVAPATVLAQDAVYTCTDRSGGASTIQARLTDVRFAHHDGYDRIVFEFANTNAVPSYRLTQQGPTFITDPKGERRTLEGSAGLRTVFDGTDWTRPVPLTDAKPRLPVIREVANIGSFEGVTSYGIGLSNRACFRTLELKAPVRLVIDFAAPSDQPAALTASSNSSSTASQNGSTASASNDPVAAADPSALAQTGRPASSADAGAGINYLGLLAAGLGALLVVLGGVRLATRRS